MIDWKGVITKSQGPRTSMIFVISDNDFFLSNICTQIFIGFEDLGVPKGIRINSKNSNELKNNE